MMRILVAGGDGQVGREFAELQATDGVDIIRCDRRQLDITRPDSIEAALHLYQPDALVNAAAYTAVDRAETNVEQAFAINAQGPEHLARAAARCGIPLVHISTDYVFDGDKPIGQSYTEQDICEPRTVYGQSKLAGERMLRAAWNDTYVLRTSWVFGRFGSNFPKTMLRLASERDVLRVVNDQWGCPTHAADIAQTIVRILQTRDSVRPGIYHYAGDTACTWFDLADYVLEQAAEKRVLGHKILLEPIPSSAYPVPAPRPFNSVLDSSVLLSSWSDTSATASDWRAGVARLLTSGNT